MTNKQKQIIISSLTEMVDELNQEEINQLEDIIVNECNTSEFTDENGDYPNLFRMLVIGGFR